MRSREYYEAVAFAAQAHAGATYGDLPYWVHPLAVADALVDHGIDDRVTLLSALLHDVVEDTHVGARELERRFGPEVASVVAEVTDARDQPRSEQLEQQIARAGRFSAEAMAVKAADRLVNLSGDIGRKPLTQARVAHSRRLHDALGARCRELGGTAGLHRLLDSFDRLIRHREGARG